ncbi:simple sugar transport system substrate-binding protein [Rhodobium orientis]|uniref:BMP family ABC transporter substrate-binding protein n=1 Tax=Rhodobium orientis TaxID=34017 RepID=A0A327JTN3_9HYPH|nr:BMP family ABC transporter substrate-binding protein [Rhodobium orientis]MBB4302269.1 simple sugar transport system substrate-binding protein [Rhodobium orientis]MBK5948979.1 BMP family ABC transporter substrate-binding protein [Rhodobium orientis]RAI28975.1 BMP family ABC transporter substrate-binding protein [Rhodobium orientis]
MRKSFALAGAVLALGMMAGGANAADKVKACFVYVGPHNDGGWSQGHDTARLYAEEKLGDAVETAYVESIPEGPDAERAIERFARSGCNIIFTTSFGFMDPTIKVAKKFPDIKFEHATGFKTAENVTSYNARFYEGRYIIGQIAAKVSKNGVAGYIASFPIPEVVMGINAFMLGAQSVNPDFKIKVVWVNTWFDPGKEGDAAKALFDQGADVSVQHTDSPAPLQIAQERGLQGFGQAHDMIEFAPKAQLTAIEDHWGPYYVRRIQAVIDGTWKSQASWEGLKDGLVVMAPYTNMPAEVAEEAKATQAAIESGELHPFKGPIFKQDGTQVIGEGEALDDGTLLGMNWYVKGIDDQLPK